MAILGSRDRRSRLLAEAVANGESVQDAGRRLGINEESLRAWPTYGSFRTLETIHRAEAAGYVDPDPDIAKMVALVLHGRPGKRAFRAAKKAPGCPPEKRTPRTPEKGPPRM